MLSYIIFPLYFILGAIFGSFLNVIICRVPSGLSIVNPPSHCFGCGKRIKFYDNIPIISYIILGGKCRYCGSKISIRDFFVELCNAVLWLFVAVAFFDNNILLSIIFCFSISILIIIACIDMDEMYIPDLFVIILAVLGLVVAIFTPFDGYVLGHFIGALIGGGFLLLVYGVGYLIKKTEVLGLGDVKLMAAAGLLLGIKGICVAYVVAIFVALIGVIVRAIISRKKQLSKKFAFAPYLVCGIITAMFFGEVIMNAYLSLF